MSLTKRKLGQTNLELAIMGLGTVKFGRNTQVKYPQAFEIPSLSTINEILSLAKQLGINTLDTAPAYGDAESKLGKIFQDKSNAIKRDDWIIISKAGEEFHNTQSHYNFEPDAIDKSITRSLKRLTTDSIDILLIHSDGCDQSIADNDKLWQKLEYRKKLGDIKAYGVSSKTITGGLACLERSDLAMVTYRPDYQDEKPLLDYAQKNNKGIILKKVLNSGHLNQETTDDYLQFACSHPAVSSMIIGTINPVHLQQNASCLTRCSSDSY